jgi:hypothetical protein
MATFFLHHFQFVSQLGSHNSRIVNLKKAMLFHLNKTCNLVKPKIVLKNVEFTHLKLSP